MSQVCAQSRFPNSTGMNSGNFFAELKRRNVYKVAVAYAVVAWLLIQAASILFPTFEAPAWMMKIFVAFVILGFPVALVSAWAFELTPQGIKRTEDVDPGKPIGRKTGRKITAAVVVIAMTALGLMIFRFVEKNTAREQSATSISLKSIAVLPFQNLSEEKANAFFADGVQDEILTNLAKVADLKVISRTSVMQYKDVPKRNLREIASALGVAHVIEGSVQRSGNRVRVNAQLIDARNDAHLWAETYDRDLADIFAIQSEIAKAIADQLQAKLSPQENAVMQAKPTSDMAAYDLYLQAIDFERGRTSSVGSGGVEQTKQQVRLLEEAVQRDPLFVSALCRLARAHVTLYWQGVEPVKHLDLANKTLAAAARLEPDAGEVHLVRGLIYYWSARDYAPALAEFALAQRSLPNDPNVLFFIAAIERRQDKWDESTRHIEQAMTLDPRNIQLISELAGSNYWVLRRYGDAAKILDDALAWAPLDYGLGFLRAYIDWAWKADLRRWKAVVAGDAATSADPNDLTTARLNLALKERDYHAAERILASPDGMEYDDDAFFTPREWNQAIVARGLGDNARANIALRAARDRAAAAVRERPEDAKSLIVLGQIDAASGRKEDAIREGQRATELLPLAKDVLNGNQLLVRLTQIYAQVGEIDRALDLLAKVIHKPDGSSYGSLKLDQVWDPLRGDPRFEKIVASLAPKN